MSDFTDDKAPHCIPFILSRLEEHKARFVREPAPPFFLGVNGVQGAGKSTLVSALQRTLSSPPHNLTTVVLSIDDLYLSHSEQTALSRSNPSNPLIQHRGQPSTHDLELGRKLFTSLQEGNPFKIPAYDKSAFNGAGDRTPEETWRTVNAEGDEKTQVVIFEGWCVGFRPLTDGELDQTWKTAVGREKLAQLEGREPPSGRLGKQKFRNIKFINEALKGYDELTNQLDAFIHIDAEDPIYVYDWRREAEATLRATKGSGMTDEQVVEFVNGYYPAYELYTSDLRHGIFNDPVRQLRLVVGKDRKVKKV
ncbi:putative Uridine/cytidine kinase, partial [Patellaria atrata CBS 101060]